MAKQKRQQGIKQTATSETFYVAEKTSGPEYVSGYNKTTHTPEFSTDINQAIWSYDSAKVQAYITRNNITNVTVQIKNGDHPTGKPPL